MMWIRQRVDAIAQAASWLTALCSFTCAALALFLSAAPWIAAIGVAGGAIGMIAIWAGSFATKDRDRRIALNEHLTLHALGTIHANAPLF